MRLKKLKQSRTEWETTTNSDLISRKKPLRTMNRWAAEAPEESDKLLFPVHIRVGHSLLSPTTMFSSGSLPSQHLLRRPHWRWDHGDGPGLWRHWRIAGCTASASWPVRSCDVSSPSSPPATSQQQFSPRSFLHSTLNTSTFGVCPFTLPARAKEPWTFPE